MHENVMCPYATEVVNKLFTVFYAICGGFDTQFNDKRRLDLLKTQWVMALQEAGIKKWEQVDPGIKHCRTRERLYYVPHVADFLKWCQPSKADLGLPETHDAYIYATVLNRRPADNHAVSRLQLSESAKKVISHAIQQSDPLLLRQMPADKARKTFSYYYENSVRQFLNNNMSDIQPPIENHTENKKDDNIFNEYRDCKGYNKAMGKIKDLLSR